MTEISNNIAAHFAALSGRNAGNTKATAAQVEAQTLPEQTNIAATLKADNSNFTPTEAVQKEAAKWETFAADTLNEINAEMNHHNVLKNLPESYWAQVKEASGPELLAIHRTQINDRMAETEGNLVIMQQSLADNSFNVDGDIYQKNDLGEFGFGDFQLSKSGLGYELLFTGPDERTIDYSPMWGRGNKPEMNNDLQALLFRENHL